MPKIPHRTFVVGTDTAAGKTIVTASILQKINSQSRRAIGLKPISSGAEYINNKLVQEDVELINQFSYISEDISPWCYLPAIAPHIAAKLCYKPITASAVEEYLHKMNTKYSEYTILAEGAGGINIPLNDNEFFTDIIKATNWPVILVVGLKLGALNHALLTYQGLINHNIKIAGMVIKQVAPMENVKENIATLTHHISCPYIGFIPWFDQPQSIVEYAKHLRIDI